MSLAASIKQKRCPDFPLNVALHKEAKQIYPLLPKVCMCVGGGPNTRPLPYSPPVPRLQLGEAQGSDLRGSGAELGEQKQRSGTQRCPSQGGHCRQLAALNADLSPLQTTADVKDRRRAWRRLQPPLLAAGPAAARRGRRPGPASSPPQPFSRPSVAWRG